MPKNKIVLNIENHNEMSYLIFDDESKAYWTDRRKPLSAEYKYESQFLMQRTLWNSSLIPALGYEWMLPGNYHN